MREDARQTAGRTYADSDVVGPVLALLAPPLERLGLKVLVPDELGPDVVCPDDRLDHTDRTPDVAWAEVHRPAGVPVSSLGVLGMQLRLARLVDGRPALASRRLRW
jgi:hypothetical protein